MSAWNTDTLADAVPQVVVDATPVTSKQTPQEHGWAPKQGFNYAEYNKTNKEIAEEIAAKKETAGEGENDQIAAGQPASGQLEIADAVGGLRFGDWSSNAAVYEWQEEFGDVGPAFPELEKQLFGSEFHVKAGINFSQ
jgi:ATP-dependent RNA helicase DDX3X